MKTEDSISLNLNLSFLGRESVIDTLCTGTMDTCPNFDACVNINNQLKVMIFFNTVGAPYLVISETETRTK